MTRSDQLETLARDTHSFLGYMGRLTGKGEEWPIKIICDGDHIAGFLERINRISNDLKALGFSQTEEHWGDRE